MFANGYSANMALFETFFTKEDAIIVDKLAHESLKEGADLTRAQRYYFPHNDMKELEKRLQEADKAQARFKIIATDGLSASTGDISKIHQICDLADKYDAIVLVDECHSFGILGEKGRGAAELEGALDRVDLITGTFGKAVGGCNGGFISGNKDVIDLVRQKGRPYLFSNTIPQFTASTYTYALEIIQKEPELRKDLVRNIQRTREGLSKMGIKTTDHKDSPIIPIAIGSELNARMISDELIKEGILILPSLSLYTPTGESTLRLQITAKHTEEQIKKCLEVIKRTFKNFGLIE